MNQKSTKKRKIVIILIALVLAVGVGYALFTDTLQISGTANVSGSFDMQFVADAQTPSNGCYVKSQQGCTATVTVGNESTGTNVTNDKLTVSVANLAYPGAGADIQVVVKNLGTIPAKVKSITPSPAPTGNGNAIVISGLSQITTSHPTINANDTCRFNFTVMWDPSVTTLDNTLAGENGNNYTFDLVIEYEQDTTNLNVTPAHSDT